MATSTENTTTKKTGSVVKRFNAVLLLIYILAIAITAPAIYLLTKEQVHTQAERELSMLVDMVKSIQGYVAKDLRPYFMKNELFHSPGLSGIVATSLIARNYSKIQPEFYIKSSSDNPLYDENSPQAMESLLLERFRMNPELKQLTQVGQLNGKTMLISAAPKTSKPGCLRCHGKKEDAPQEIQDQYPGFNGYNYQPNTVVGVSVVAVPLENVEALSMKRAGIVLGVMTAMFTVLLITVNSLVRGYLIKPILKITQAAHNISHGKLEQKLTSERNDEIGDLERSVELVRRSIEKMLQRMKKH